MLRVVPAPTILLTGGTGFLGSHLLGLFLRKGYKVVLLKRRSSETRRIADVLPRVRCYDVDTMPDLRRIFEENRITMIVHSATDYGRREVPPLDILRANLTLPLELLQLAVDYRVPAFVNTDTLLDKRVSHYSLSKKQFLDWLMAYGSRLTCCNLALEHFYGAHDDDSKFVSRIVHELLREVPELQLTPGMQKRDFIHIDDVVTAFEAVVDLAPTLGPGFFPFEVGTNELTTIKDLVELAKTLTANGATALRFGAIPYRENEVMESRCDTTALRKLGWEPKVGLQEGLKRMIREEKLAQRRSSKKGAA